VVGAGVAAHEFGQFEPVHPRHLHVEQSQRDIVLEQDFKRFLARMRAQEREPVAAQQRLQRD